MSKNEKLSKLGNAIKRYRGLKCSNTGKWVVPPNKGELKHVVRWLKELKVNERWVTWSIKPLDHPDSNETWEHDKALELINKFEKIEEFNTWISKL